MSQDQKRTIPCALQAGFSGKKKEFFQEKCQCWRPASVMLPLEFMKTRDPHGNVCNFYWFSEPNIYCFDRAGPGQLSKFNWRNTVTVLKTLVNCHKCLNETELLPESCSSVKLF